MAISAGSQAATTANVASSATSVPIFAAGSGAKVRTVWNDSSAILYLKFGATASITSATVAIASQGYYEFPQPVYAGQVDGIWASANGFARTTQY